MNSAKLVMKVLDWIWFTFCLVCVCRLNVLAWSLVLNAFLVLEVLEYRLKTLELKLEIQKSKLNDLSHELEILERL